MKYAPILLALALAAPAAGQPPIERMEESTVRVFCETSTDLETGSAIVVRPDVVATNHHVIECAGRGGTVYVGSSPDALLESTVLWSSPASDLALVRTPERLGRPVVRLVPHAFVRSDDEVRAIGFPGAADAEAASGLTTSMFVPSVTRGIVSRAVVIDGVPYYQTDAAISGGSSGGPLFDVCGSVIGINRMVALGEAGEIAQGIGYAIRADVLLGALRANGLPADSTTVRCTAATTRPPAETARPPATVPAATNASPGRVSTAWFGWLAALAAVAALAVFVVHARRRPPAGYNAGHEAAPEPEAPAYEPPVAPAPVLLAPAPVSGPALVAFSGHLAGARVPFAGRTLTLGRDARVCEVAFPETASEVSKRHAALVWDGARGVAFVKDLGSTNGTFLATGERLTPGEPRALRPGERFYLGHEANAFAVHLT